MTENEALITGKALYENITSNANNIILTNKYIKFVEIAIQALEEIQQYRTIGTVEELIKTQIREKVLNVELESYKEIGTIEEFKTLKEKSVARHEPINVNGGCIYNNSERDWDFAK